MPKQNYDKQESIPVECVPSALVVRGGEVGGKEGVFGLWGCLALAERGGSGPGGTTPVNTDTCKNITFPQLRLRTVINVDIDLFQFQFPVLSGADRIIRPMEYNVNVYIF